MTLACCSTCEKSQKQRAHARISLPIVFLFASLSYERSAKANDGIFANSNQKKGHSSYFGIGYSGSNFGRQIPGLHFAFGYKLFEAAFFASGTDSGIGSTSNQNLLVTAHALTYDSQYFSLTNGIGIGFQNNTRIFHSHVSSDTNKTNEKVTNKETDNSIGPGFSATACSFTYFCLRIETLLGMHEGFFEQIYQENAIASIGVQL